MSMTPDEFNQKIKDLSLGMEGDMDAVAKTLEPKNDDPQRVQAIVERALENCKEYLVRSEYSIQAEVEKGSWVGKNKELESRCNEIFEGISKIKKLYNSKLGKSFEPDFYEIDKLKTEIDKNLRRIHLVQECIAKDAALGKLWNALSEKAQKGMMIYVLEDSDILNSPEAFPGVLKLLAQATPYFLSAQIFTYTVSEYLTIYRNSPEESSEETARVILQFLKNMDALNVKVKSSYFSAALYAFKQRGETHSLSDIEKNLKTFFSLCLNPRFNPNTFTYVISSLLPLAAKDENFFIYLLENKEKIKDINYDLLLEYSKYGSIAGCKALIELYVQIPIDASYSLESVLLGGWQTVLLKNISSDRIAKLDLFLIWINESIKKDPSEANKKKMSSLLDRVMAVFLSNPSMADVLSELPKEKYSLLELCLTVKDEIEKINEKDIQEVLIKANESKLAKDILEKTSQISTLSTQLNKAIQQSAPIGKAIHAFLDVLLRMHHRPVAQNAALLQKLEQLPIGYLQLLDRMLILSKGDSSLLIEMLYFAEKHPYIKVLEKYMENVKNLMEESKENEKTRIETLKAFNTLCDAFPKALQNLLSMKLNIFPSLFGFLKQDKALLGSVLEKYPKWIDEIKLKALFSDPSLQKSFRMLLEIGAKNHISLLELLDECGDQIKEEKFLAALQRNPDFGLRLVPHNLFGEERKDFLNKVIKLLATHEKEVFQLFEISVDTCPSTIFRLIKDLSSGKSLMFFSLLQSKHPGDLKRILFLFEKDKQKLAEELFKIYPSNPELFHNLLDMAYANYSQEVETLLKLAKSSSHPFVKKLFALANSKNAALVTATVSLKLDLDNVSNPPVLLSEFLKGKIDEVPPLYYHLMVLRARNETELLKEALNICASETNKRSQFAQTAIQAITEGRYLLAKEILKKQGKPYLDSVKEIPSISMLQKCHDLSLDLLAIDPRKLRKQDDIKLLNQALNTFTAQYIKDPKNEKIFCAWVGKVQFLLQHNPQRLFDIIQAEGWQKIDKNPSWEISKDIEAVLEPLSQLESLSKENLEKVRKLGDEQAFQKASLKEKNTQITQLTLKLAECLTTSSGVLNVEMVDLLLASPHYQKISQEPYAGEYIRRVMKTLKENPDFGERLSALNEIPFPSRQNTLVAKMLQLPLDKPVGIRLAKAAIISALLSPLRQELAGSCFGTSYVITLASSPEGLKQSLEYYMSLIGKSKIAVKTFKGSVEYPLVFDATAKEMRYEEDNLLAHAFEASISSIAGIRSHFDKTYETWNEIFSKAVEEGYGKGPQNLLAEETSKALMKTLRYSCAEIYDIYAKKVNKDQYGAWLLVDSETCEPLKNKEALPKFYQKVLSRTKEELLKTHVKDADAIKKVFDERIPLLLASSEYTEMFLKQIDRDKLQGLSRVNPIKYSHLLSETPLEVFEGGVSEGIFSQISGSVDPVYFIRGTPSLNPLSAFQSYSELLTDAEVAQAKENPALLKVVSSPNHGFNIKVAQIASLSKQRLALNELWTKEVQAVSKIEVEPLTPEIVKVVTQAFLNSQDKEVRIQAQFALENRVKGCKTVRDLCDALALIEVEVNGKRDASGNVSDYIEGVLRTQPLLKDRFLPLSQIYDTNWRTSTTMGYGYRIYDRASRRVISRSETELSKEDWNPGEPYDLIMYHYRNPINDFFRNYYNA